MERSRRKEIRMRRALLKSFLIIMVSGSLTALGTPTSAYVAEVLTSIPTASGEGDQLEIAVKAAIKDVLEHAIAFVPTVIDVRDARVVGDRIFILLLIADDDGAAIVKSLTEVNAEEL
jgi:hypothetical protein